MSAPEVFNDKLLYSSSPTHENDAPVLSAEEIKEARFVHPEARALFAKAPCTRNVPLFGQAAEGYGPRATLSLAMAYFLCKGLSDYLIRNATLPFFTVYYGVDGTLYQRLGNVVNMGWSLKAITALISDLFPFFRYTKRWYMLGSCLLGPAVTVAMGFLPGNPSSAIPAAGIAFVSCFTKANVDILLEGHYSRMIRRLPGPGPALVSWIWWFIMVGSLMSAVVIGPLADAGKVYLCAFLAAAFQLATCAIFIFNWYGEKPNREERIEDARLLHEVRAKLGVEEDAGGNWVEERADPEELTSGAGAELVDSAITGSGAESNSVKGAQPVVPFEFKEPVSCCCGVFEFNDGLLVRNKALTVYSILMACGVVTMALLSMLGTTFDLLYGCIAVSVILCGFNFYALPLVIAKVNMFSYLQQVSSVRFPVISTFAALIGITMFNYCLAKRSYRVAFISTTILGIVAALFDLIMVKRWNRPHINDHVMYVLGDAIVQQVIYMMNWMPMTVLLSKLCPRGTESMVYAVLAGFANLGQSMALTIGSLVMELLWPVQTKPPCDFSNLPKMIILAGMALPLVQIPLCFVLIPSARICDDIPIEESCLREEVGKGKKAKDSRNA